MNSIIPILFLLLPLSPHKYYESLTDINYNEEIEVLEISSRYFADDLEKALDLDRKTHFVNEMDSNLLATLSDYMVEHLTIQLDDKACNLTVIGYEVENDLVWVYVESEKVSDFNEVTITADQLCNAFKHQKNIVHFTKSDKLQSLFLEKHQAMGSLHFD